MPGLPDYTNFKARAALGAALALLLICFPAFVPFAASRQGSPVARADTSLPQLVDVTDSTGIKFDHLSSPEQKYIVESMSGGVALIDYDRDGWPDIYFTNAQSVEMALAGKKARGRALSQ